MGTHVCPMDADETDYYLVVLFEDDPAQDRFATRSAADHPRVAPALQDTGEDVEPDANGDERDRHPEHGDEAVGRRSP